MKSRRFVLCEDELRSSNVFTEKNLGEFLVGDLSLPCSTEMHANEIRIEVEREFLVLFRRWDDELEIIEGDHTLSVTIEELKRQSIQRVRGEKKRFEVNELGDGNFYRREVRRVRTDRKNKLWSLFKSTKAERMSNVVGSMLSPFR